MKPTDFDLTVHDTSLAQAFFEQVLGWRFEKFAMPSDYYRIQAGPESEPGINGGIGAVGDAESDAPRAIRIYPPQRMALAIALAFVSFCASALPGCATVITPQTAPSDPVNVFVVDHGGTSTLVVPAPDGTLLRYAYGDWNWYALSKHTLWRGIAALFWPTQGALGRGTLKGPGTIESVRQQVPSPDKIHSVPVERARLLTFEHRMEALYDSRRATEVSNPAVGMSFVHHPRPYTYFWNSNHAVASWLRELGCTTRGLSFRASWQVAAPPDQAGRALPPDPSAHDVAVPR